MVELCVPVQIQFLEIGNLELFSSLPERFVVHVSDRSVWDQTGGNCFLNGGGLKLQGPLYTVFICLHLMCECQSNNLLQSHPGNYYSETCFIRPPYSAVGTNKMWSLCMFYTQAVFIYRSNYMESIPLGTRKM